MDTTELNPIKIEAIMVVDKTGEYACIGINDVVTLIPPQERVTLGLDPSFTSAKQNYEMLKNYLERFFSEEILKIGELRVWSENYVTVCFNLVNDAVISCDLRNFMRID